MRAPFVLGREREADALIAALETHALVSVRGPMGIGKTTLAQRVVAGAAETGKLPPPVLVSLLGVTSLRGALEEVARALGRKRPSVHDEGAAAALARLLDGAPATLILDDADALGALLQPLVGALDPAGKARVILVSRAAIVLDPPPPVVELGPLDVQVMRELVLALESARGRTLYDDILKRAGGNPLVLQLILVAGVGEVRDAVQQSVDGLSPPARDLLSLLAAARRSLARSELEIHLGSLEAALAELRLRLLVTDEDGLLSLPVRVSQTAGPLLPAPSPELWKVLAELAERALLAAPGDGDAWMLSCRARAHAGNSAEALDRLERHEIARASVPTATLEALVQEMSSIEPLPELPIILAREQLRAGDVERACRTLDGVAQRELPAHLRRTVHLLRMEALVRFGDPRRAAHELSQAEAPPSESPDDFLPLAIAGLTAIAGNVAEARRQLRELAPRTRSLPHLEAQRAAWMAMSYLCDERYARGVVWTRRARREYGKIDAPPSFAALVPTSEIIALLELNRIDEAAALASRLAAAPGKLREKFEPLGRDLGTLFDAGIAGRRGRLRDCLPRLESVYATLDAQADRAARAVAARYLARTCVQLGDTDRAEEYLRVSSGVAADAGLGGLKPLVDREWALLEEARGRLDEARTRLQLALEASPSNPLAVIDAWGLDPRDRPVPREACGAASLQAWAALRSAERALDRGDGATAQAAAQAAERLYDEAGLLYETTRARLLRAESQVLLGKYSQADALAIGCEAPAEQHGYRPLLVAAALVRAAAAERDGRPEATLRHLRLARARAGADAAVESVCARMGVPDAITSAAPSGARRMIDRLGLLQPFTHLVTVGDRAWPGQPAAAVDLMVDLDGAIVIGPEHVSWPQARIDMLARLVEAGPSGLSLEQMYLELWKGSEYHPLRHRNMVYVALQRVRSELRALTGGEPITLIDESRYALAPGLRVAVRRPLPDGWLQKLNVTVEREAVIAARSAAFAERRRALE